MKKLSAIFTSLLLLCSMTNQVHAETEQKDDLIVLSKEDIVKTCNGLFRDELDEEITIQDVDFENAVKIYVGPNIFDTDADSIEEIEALFDSDEYIYELPIYVDGGTLIVNIEKGKELNPNANFTESEKQRILDNVGKWQCSSYTFYPNETIDYASEVESKMGVMPENMILVGGLPYFRFAVALIPDETGKLELLVPLKEVPGEENISQFRAGGPEVYAYDQIKEFINQLPPTNKYMAYGFENVSAEKEAGNRNVKIREDGLSAVLPEIRCHLPDSVNRMRIF